MKNDMTIIRKKRTLNQDLVDKWDEFYQLQVGTVLKEWTIIKYLGKMGSNRAFFSAQCSCGAIHAQSWLRLIHKTDCVACRKCIKSLKSLKKISPVNKYRRSSTHAPLSDMVQDIVVTPAAPIIEKKESTQITREQFENLKLVINNSKIALDNYLTQFGETNNILMEFIEKRFVDAKKD